MNPRKWGPLNHGIFLGDQQPIGNPGLFPAPVFLSPSFFFFLQVCSTSRNVGGIVRHYDAPTLSFLHTFGQPPNTIVFQSRFFKPPRTANVPNSLDLAIQRIQPTNKAPLNAGLKASIIHQKMLA